MEDLNKIVDEKEINESEFFETIKAVIYSSIGIFIFFIPLNINGYTTTFIYHIVEKIQSEYISLLKIVVVIFIFLGCISNIIKKNDKKVEIILNVISLVIMVNIFYGNKNIPIIDDNTIFLIEEYVLNISTILPVSAIGMVFILEYGLVDIVESYFHKFMKKTYKMSGKTILNILVYLFTDVFCGYFMTNRMYKSGKLRENESVMLITNFSVASIWALNYISSELNLRKFGLIILSLIVVFIVNVIICRIYPINKKKKSYYVKTTYKETLHKNEKFKKGINKYLRNNKKKNILKEILNNLEESFHTIINLIPAIIIIFFLADIVYSSSLVTTLFTYIFSPFLDLLKLTNEDSIIKFLSLVIFNDVIAVDSVLNSVAYTTRLILGVITAIGCISISTNIIYLKYLDINISLKELLIVFVERIILILIVYSIISYTLIGYFM